MTDPIAEFNYVAGKIDEVLEFLKRTRSELRMLRLVRVWTNQFRVFDVNGDCFEVRGLGYLNPDVVAALDAINTAYKRESIHMPTNDDFKEFKTGRRYPWAADRVM